MQEFIARNTPKVKENFIIKTIEQNNCFDTYEIYAEDGKIVLAGSSNLCIAMAFYRYLNEYCNIVITSGNFNISGIARTPLPESKITYMAKQKIRARMSYEMFSLEGNYWGFDRWEKEIDFMAMHGINTALQCVGFDGVLYHALVDMGMSEEFCLEFSSGPAFITRQLTGNIVGTSSINSLDYLERKIAIGKMITQREKEIGITPVLPAALPSIPFSLRKKYIKMDIFKAPLWYNFPPIFYIKPDNAFFEIFNKKFLTIQRELIGETDSFFFEPLYDVEQKGFNSYLSSLGKALSDVLSEFDDNSVCYIHSSSINTDFFKNVSSKRYILIGETNDKSLTDGKNMLAEIIGNKYGRTGLYGDIEKICKNPYAVEKNNGKTVLGSSVDIDTFDENPLYCAAVLESIKSDSAFDADEFIKDFSRKRYGIDSYCDELIDIKNLCYKSDECAGSILCARPSTQIKHTAPFDTIERQYDFHKLYEITKKIIKKDDRKNDKMRADIQSFVRQIFSELLYHIYLFATESFKAKNIKNYEQASNLFLEICEDMDRLLKTRSETDFFTKIDEARVLGNSKEEKQDIEINYLMLHTIWGPVDHTVLFDTVWNEWSGLIKDYYAQRWFMYFRSLAAYFENPKKLKDNSKKQPLDRNEYKGSYQAKRLAIFENNFIENYIPRKDGIGEEDTLEVAKELVQKYSEVIEQF